ncbi:nucleoside deaminase [Rhodocytophaga aerolata]|uniref:Nucleoside deaminase n=1 Tax=Rhodocytophaga aerolata TaxID=455078 RepID=A0ABT8RH85_9BACT|nr:nucleoside deaminase [Rhodocytophaga aerolata]MDO1450523.1 nucleoside deaminase [Rhodocytophaga aerolata]
MEEILHLEEHEKWMRICLELGRMALQSGNPPVGSIIVQDGKLIGEGIEAGKSKKDITYHAEIEAIRDAITKTQQQDLREASLYTTHEPCLMCSYVIRHYKITKVIVGTPVPVIGGFSSAYPLLVATDIDIWSAPPHIITNVLKEDCQALTHAYEQKQK